ncbi:S41 family peptidase [Hymenobacter sp. GOD-10R]|uniref:S41 family peptidase n=1 Tax=Hymenobacter sp. GOD-10R TaxID=3093922 RepID=UPI002D792A46|nr:S41 family peptidase [Hymenobacter sp. GOD-10R]WRQ30418.1 S41 family peptidase [Hymenobacter sp. GOD-10R]
MKTWLLVLLLVSARSWAVAQATVTTAYDSAARYSVTQMRADLAYVRRALEEVHPALYWYTSQDTLNRAFSRAEAALTRPLSEPEFWRQLQALVVQVHCGHTRIRHSAAYQAWFRRQPHSYLPFLVVVRQNRLFITDNQSATPDLRPGTEVLAIDGHPTAELLPRLRSLIAADGYGTQFQNQELAAGFFDEYYWNFYPSRSVYPLLVADSTGQPQQLTPQPRPATPRPASAPLTPDQQRTRKLERLRSVSYLGQLPGTAVLRIREFSYDELEDYRTFHAQTFAELKQRQVKRLVLDLRGNGGGNLNLANDLLKYLLKRDFYLSKSGRGRVFLPSFMQPDSTQAAYFDTTSVRRLPGGGFAKVSSSLGQQHPYRGSYFRGQVVVLVDGGTFSAASQLAASLRAQRRVVVIGQETGGGEAGCNGGTLSELELPNTHLVLQLPHFQMLSACPRPHLGRGVQPDVEVLPTPQQVAVHADPILEQLPLLLQRH